MNDEKMTHETYLTIQSLEAQFENYKKQNAKLINVLNRAKHGFETYLPLATLKTDHYGMKGFIEEIDEVLKKLGGRG